MPRPVGALKQIIQPPRSHRDVGGGSSSNPGAARRGGSGVGHRGIPILVPDSIPEDEAQRLANQIAEDLTHLVKNSKEKAAVEQSDKYYESGKGIDYLAQTEAALLANLESNWQFLRTTAQKDKPKIDFLLLAEWFSKRGDPTGTSSDVEDDEDEISLSEALTEIEKEITFTDALKELELNVTKPAKPPTITASSDPLTLFEQIIDLYNDNIQAWNAECAKINHAYLARPPDGGGSSSAKKSNLMFFQQDCIRNPKRLDKTHPRFPPAEFVLENIRFRTEIIDALQEQYTQWEERQNEYMEGWYKQVEEKGAVKVWQEINAVIEEEWAKYRESEKKVAADLLEKKRFWYKYGEGVTRLLKVKFGGYPEELMTEEEKKRMWKNRLRGMVQKGGKKEEGGKKEGGD